MEQLEGCAMCTSADKLNSTVALFADKVIGDLHYAKQSSRTETTMMVMVRDNMTLSGGELGSFKKYVTRILPKRAACPSPKMLHPVV